MKRRDFLKRSALTALSLSPLAGVLQRLEAAQTTNSYKALVCILLEGGADSFNMIAPIQKNAYEAYQKVRGALAIDHDTMLPLAPEGTTGDWGMRDTMEGMHRLFDDKRLAIVANVGTLVRPTTLEDIRNGAPLPQQLFAHNTQRALWMLGDAKTPRKSGWAGRAANLFYPPRTPNPYFNISVAGSNLLQQGGATDPLLFDAAEISPNTMEEYGFGPEAGGGDLGSLYQALYRAQKSSKNSLMAALAHKRDFELALQQKLQGLFDDARAFDGLFSNGVHESGKPLGTQLEIVAKILSVKEHFPGKPKRQIFFVNYHGWDTHDSDNAHQSNYLSDSLAAFDTALERIGIADQVTTFTISDFGRSLSPNGAGTDHGWGGHAYVMGGAVRGGKIYGTMPQLIPDSPDAWEDRMIPTTAVETYLATIMRWFGANEKELGEIFPNLKSFGEKNMGFMG